MTAPKELTVTIILQPSYGECSHCEKIIREEAFSKCRKCKNCVIEDTKDSLDERFPERGDFNKLAAKQTIELYLKNWKKFKNSHEKH